MKNWHAIEARLPKPKKKRRWLFFLFPALFIVPILLLIGWYGNAPNPRNNKESILTETSDSPKEKVRNPELSIPASEDTSREAPEISKDHAATQSEGPFDYRAEEHTANSVTTVTRNENSTNAFVRKKVPSVKAGSNSTPETIPSESGEINDEEPSVGTYSLKVKALELLPLSARPLPRMIAKEVAKLDEEAIGITPVSKYPSVSLQAYTRLSMPFRRFSDIPAEQESYLARREDLETVRQSQETGVLINTYVTPGFSISTGIGLQKITERLDWENTRTLIVPVLSDTAYYYTNQANSRTYVADTVTAIVTETRRVKHFNTHTFFNVPLIAGYEKDMGAFTVNANAGPVLHFYRGFKGRILDENENFITGDELRTQGAYVNKVGFSLQAGFGISRPIRRFGRLYAGIQYRHGLLSVTDASTGYQQTYHSIGLNLGWSIRLSK